MHVCAAEAGWERTEKPVRTDVCSMRLALGRERAVKATLAGLGPALPLGPTSREAVGLGQAWESAFLTSTARGLGLRPALAYLCPWAAAWLKEFMSPWGVVEIPFLCMVPIKGSAPRSNSKLTSSKLPASPEKGVYKRIKQTESRRHPRGRGGGGPRPG